MFKTTLKKKWCFGLLAISFAGMNSFAGSDLSGTMKEMSSELKQIQKQVSDASQNASTIALCDQLSQSIVQAKTFTPKKVSDLPSEKQPSEQQAYGEKLDHLLETVGDMKADLEKNDNAAAQALMPDLLQTKSEGHARFK